MRPGPDEVQRERTFSPTDIEVDLEGWQGSCLCHPQALLHRVIALILMCLLGFGNYFCFDNPGALQSELKDAMNITTAQFANLYAWYSWPNVVLPIIGGFLMDRVFGIRLGTMLFAFIIIFGQIIFSMGGFLDRLWVMEVGRFVFGIGGESLSVAQNTYAVSWFKGKELNMVFGFQLSIARVGSTVNFLLMGPLFQYIKNQTLERDAAMNHSMNLFWEENLFEESYLNGSQELDLIAERDSYGPTVIGWTLLTAGGFCVASFFCSVILAWMDKRRNEILNIVEPGDSGEVVKITDVKDFPLSFWFLCLACLSYYGVIFPFVSLAKDFFKVEFDMDGNSANFITGLIYLVSAPASPLLGLLMDKTGRNISWVVLAIISSIGCICLLAFTSVNPFISISCLGVAYSLLASALWPIAALIIPEYQLGTAYGLMQAIQNLGCALIVMAAGLIADEYGYTWLMLFFLGWLFLSLTSTVCIWFCDCSTTGYLNMSISERQIFDDARQAALDAERARQIDGHRLLSRPRTDANIRNRYLSKIGAHLPAHLGQGRLIVPAHQR
ncbi:major facilitator superfamily domain-containing protein 1 isoform X2 [Eurytemora carolleeae]|uniref:major facilitator superfamily domain-containing protein 1 isoform X2 n=1 Tax=Eurytemora carolleeae TaxID=1294199 RepID=UPI000C76993F|nr:major facilitator superfamily domain-containing protein 1 isoform X2 [Eurytemora carolleeae]|eukprot:XP_023333048.1 major facilitator superfamily domain-containing protein 1-like isoform X2 [Eurytemora affinis]